MQVKIKPGNLAGLVSIPPSKSITHRVVMIASLAKGKSVIKNSLTSSDTGFTVKACKVLGAKIEKKDGQLIIEGVDGKFPLKGKKIKLFAGESGTTMRLMTAVCALTDGTVIIDGAEKLHERPIGELIKALREQGIEAKFVYARDFPPVEIKGGKLKGGELSIPSGKSSQYASALLMVAPYAAKDMILQPFGLKSSPYLTLTLRLMKEFGASGSSYGKTYKIVAGESYKGCNFTVEGDWTSASYFMVAAAVTRSTVELTNLNHESAQGDRKIISVLEKMGCKIKIGPDGIKVTGERLKAVEENLGDNPDIVPSLCVAAAFAEGKSKFTNVGHLVYKESNRLESVCMEMRKMGIDALCEKDALVISGGMPRGAVIDPHNDHRIAMSFAVAGLGADGTTMINNAGVINKSYPNFYKDLKKLGAIIL